MKALLYLSLVPYESISQRPHAFAKSLATRARLLYVDPPRSALRGTQLWERRWQVHDSLAVLVPAAGLPITGYFRSLNRIQGRLAARRINAYLASLGWSPPIHATIATFPKHVDWVRYLNARYLVYDIMDDYPEFFNGLQKHTLRKMHHNLLCQAHHVVTSSQTLTSRVAPWVQHATEIENGVYRAFIHSCQKASSSPRLATLGHPRFGYVGAIDSWFDFEAVRSLAVSFPNGSVVLVGPHRCPIPPLPANVHFMGRVPHEELPRYLIGFNVGLVPFLGSSLIEAVNPVKVYEYLAAGLPILATDFTEMRRFASVATIARTEDWPAAARGLLREPPEVASQRRVAANATWEARVDTFWRLLETL